ncbi:MAG: sulfotransferase family 2 domain-containing protein, partial [Gemmatimonadota bacterium]
MRSLLRQLVDTLAWTVAEGSMQRRREKSFGLEFPDDFDRTASIFVHVPRTAGTSMGMALYGRQVKHHMWSQWVEINPRKCREYFSFAVVRDPIKRFLSACEFLKDGGMNPADQQIGVDLLAGFDDAEQFILSMKKDMEAQKRLLAYWHFRPQSDFLDAKADRPKIKTLIPFEHLESGVRKVATTLGMNV